MADNKALVINLITPPFRMAFPALFEPTAIKGSAPKYKVTALFPPDADLKELKRALIQVMEDRFGPKESWPKGRNDVLPRDKLSKAETKPYQGFNPGWLACTFSTQNQPGVVDANKQEVLSPRQAYGGRWARAAVAVTTYVNKEFGTKGVSVYLNHVQLLEDDERFDSQSSAKNVFDVYQLKDQINVDNPTDGGFDDLNDARPSSRSTSPRAPSNDDGSEPANRRASTDRDRSPEQSILRGKAAAADYVARKAVQDPDVERNQGWGDRPGDDDDWN